LKKKNLFSVSCDSSNIGVFLVHELSDLEAWPLTSVIKKYVKLPFKQICSIAVIAYKLNYEKYFVTGDDHFTNIHCRVWRWHTNNS